ncbi:multidrug ABC transporter ATP-binding protein [Nocardiopsis terrae]|uniref:ABC-type multidrug transport system fused ATPase/permease subunit n=1 Tax=Nocardiopsis terrae TaxID=372655 RepID=A0ABR9HBL2_9ACTN|nr:ABC transporter ATP-binding protein [Nocardiopsis terrae]MBE1456210.1 ABC-type multidrug transport system fused ATPase/permease subunit [Nocardiopsis terrae]GHC78167.1 multidrug ABC transporter ATP-binding protein [Nocardiopsis terrae]
MTQTADPRSGTARPPSGPPLTPVEPTALPVAPAPVVWRRLRRAGREHGPLLFRVVALYTLATAAALVAPWVLGMVVDAVRDGTEPARVDAMALVIVAALLVNTGLVLGAVAQSIRFGEELLAELREEFVRSVLRLPLGTVERAGTGDLVSRTGRDINSLSTMVRQSLPVIATGLATVLVILVAQAFLHPALLLAWLPSVLVIWVGTRWYAHRAPDGYLAEMSTYSRLTQGVSDTVEGAHTLEALGRQEWQDLRTDADVHRSYLAERYTLWLRCVWYPPLEFSYLFASASTFLVAGALYAQGELSLGQIATAVFLTVQMSKPLDHMIDQIDNVMVGFTAMRRLLGVRLPAETPRPGAGPGPRGPGAVEVHGVRFGYDAGTEVLHGVDLDLRPGERLAVVGPSGAGKSTLGKLLAGVHLPGTGTVRVDGVDLAALSPEERRKRVILLSQESHVFRGTLAENLALALAEADADRERLWRALEAVGADAWVRSLPDGLDTRVGSGQDPLDPAHVQQLALARVVLADPRVLVLDEATSLIDPRSARRLERSLAGVLTGRTVVAIAHRLYTAHDADRVAVVEDGGVSELGTHGELLDRGGSYARLWHAWHGED